MIDEQRLQRYAEAIARVELDRMIGPDQPLPAPDHSYWDVWKTGAAAVITLADEEHPPPPNSTVKQLPDSILDLIIKVPYLSTACDVARRLQSAIVRHPDHAGELADWRDIKHSECRQNNKHTGMTCSCGCHGGVE